MFTLKLLPPIQHQTWCEIFSLKITSSCLHI